MSDNFKPPAAAELNDGLEEWQLEQIYAGIEEADAGKVISHEKVVAWLRSWGTPGETKPPR
jgi:predicted transcriptional regulator